MSEEIEELIQFANLESAKKMLIEKLKFDFRSGVYANIGYSYERRIEEILMDYNINKVARFRVDSVVIPIDEFNAEVLIYSYGVNDSFIFNAHMWIREYKLKNLL